MNPHTAQSCVTTIYLENRFGIGIRFELYSSNADSGTMENDRFSYTIPNNLPISALNLDSQFVFLVVFIEHFTESDFFTRDLVSQFFLR